MTFTKKINTALDIWKRGGIRGIGARLRWNAHQQRQTRAYDRWLAEHGTVGETERGELVRRITSFKNRPLISVILPVYNVDEKWLRRCIDSVMGQIYENWELCIADDRSDRPHIARVLDEYAKSDERIRVVFRDENGHISAASNSALALANGDFIVLLDHDDELAADALFWVVREIEAFPNVAMIYSDEDMIDTRGRRYGPKFKPDFSRDLLYSLNLVTHLSAYRSDIVKRIGGFRIGAEGSQDYDLALRVLEQIEEHQVRHIPRILYHWRAIPGSVALDSGEKPYAHERARQAIRDHLARTGVAATVEGTVYDLHRVHYEILQPRPSVTVISHAGHRTAAVELAKYSDAALAAESYSEPARNSAAALNSAAEHSLGDVLIFIADGLSPVDGRWVEEFVRLAMQPAIGLVGGKIIAPDLSTVKAGVIVGPDGSLHAAHRGFPKDVGGNMVRNLVIGNYSAVSADCMAVRRDVFQKLGGFDAENFPNTHFAADLCLKSLKDGMRVVFTPHAEFIQNNNVPNSAAVCAEARTFCERWPEICRADPFYSPNLLRSDGTFAIDI